MSDNVVMLSIHPKYVRKILSGEKRVEFRRRWTRRDVDKLVIYATAPIQKVVAVAGIKKLHRGNKSRLWQLSQTVGGGLEQSELSHYFEGVEEGYAIELDNVYWLVEDGIPLSQLPMHLTPPQSFRFLSLELYNFIETYLDV